MDYYSGPLQVGDGTAVYTYVGETNRLSQVTAATSTSFSQDAVGNICAIGLRTLLYNQDNRLVRVREGTSILGEYLYNAFSQRTSKTAGGVTTHYLYDFEGNLISEADAAGFVQAEYLYRDGVRLAMAVPSTGAVHFFHNDLVGTPQFMTDSTNTLVWEAIYKPFRETAVTPRSTVVNNFRFQGQYFDQETGYHYNWHRYYDPKTGRYLTPDPIGLAGGINPYVYVLNDPINRVDPLGLSTEIAVITDGGVGGSRADFFSNATTGPDLHQLFWYLLQDMFYTNLLGRGQEILYGEIPVLGPARLATTNGVAKITKPYRRPSGATTAEQRACVQGKPCIDCEATTTKQIADHKTPLVQEYYETGTIDATRMHSVDAVQPQCPTCSARQGAALSRYSRHMKKELGLE